MQFYFIRHAESTNNRLWADTGSSIGRVVDPPLTELGFRQAERLGAFLARPWENLCSNPAGLLHRDGFGITHLYSSLMTRAVQTGTIVASALGMPVYAWEDLHEEGGIYLEDEMGQPLGQPGENRAYFNKNFPNLVLPEKLGETGWWNRPWEKPELRIIRARRFLADLLKRHDNPSHRVAVVSHGGFFNHLMAAVLDGGLKPGAWFTSNNCAITRIDFEDGDRRILYTNRVDFLPADLMS